MTLRSTANFHGFLLAIHGSCMSFSFLSFHSRMLVTQHEMCVVVQVQQWCFPVRCLAHS